MKLKDVNLNKTHYILLIYTMTNNLRLIKTNQSVIKKYRGYCFLSPNKNDNYSYAGNWGITSVEINPEEIIYATDNYIRFNLNYTYRLSYIIFDLPTTIKIIKQFFKKQYNTVKQTEGRVYRSGYSKDIQEMYKQYIKQIKWELYTCWQ
jgi:hypothetical protein